MFFHLLVQLRTIDPALGRLDYDSLSDQANMEILVEALDDDFQRTVRDRNGNFLDVCDWPCVECNDDEDVVKVTLKSKFNSIASGTVNFSHIPRNVVEFRARTDAGHFLATPCSLTGTIATERLSSIIQVFDVDHCIFHGTLEMKTLLRDLRSFDVSHNRFEGECDLTALPRGLEQVYAMYNQMTGTVRLDKLPEKLATLNLSHNKFTGSIDLSHLPAALDRLVLAYNSLSGEINLESLPPNLRSLVITENNFSGKFQMRKNPASLRQFDASKNAFMGTAVIPWEDYRFHMGSNFLTAVVDEFGVKHTREAEILRQQRRKAVE